MKQIIIVLLSVFILTDIKGQVVIFQDGDPRYQDRVIWEHDETIPIWNLKPILAKGQYWIINQTECGPDTLKYAEFIADGVKHGTWIQWHSGICIGIYGDNSDTIEIWNFASDKVKDEEIIYESGFLVKSTLFHLRSNQPHWELFYPKHATKENEWIEERIWREDGTLRWIIKVDEDGTAQQKDFYPNGQVKSFGQFGINGTFIDLWEYYYENGRIMAKGEHEPLGKGEVRFYAGLRIPKGYWQYWDESGELIAQVTFKKGKPKKIKKYQNKTIPFPDVNEMIMEF
jgi:antitoxin component YwqK of YwqJK toxin-antitoxin module